MHREQAGLHDPNRFTKAESFELVGLGCIATSLLWGALARRANIVHDLSLDPSYISNASTMGMAGLVLTGIGFGVASLKETITNNRRSVKR